MILECRVELLEKGKQKSPTFVHVTPRALCRPSGNLVSYLHFSKLLIIHPEKTKEITTVKEVWICDLNYHKIW